jgi:hypothetical protein
MSASVTTHASAVSWGVHEVRGSFRVTVKGFFGVVQQLASREAVQAVALTGWPGFIGARTSAVTAPCHHR